MGISRRSLPTCCGVQVISRLPFYYNTFEANTAEMKILKTDEYLKKMIKENIQMAWIFVILNTRQECHLGKVFLKNGFVLKEKRQNPNSGSMLYFYILKPKIKGIK